MLIMIIGKNLFFYFIQVNSVFTQDVAELTEEYARQDDNYLILRVIQEVEPELAGTTFVNVMQRLSYKGVSCESITRARRDWAEKHPDLKVDKAERARRQKEEEYYLEYSRHIPRVD